MKFPEWLPDRDEFENPGLVQCLNVIPDTFYRPIFDLVPSGTAMTDIALGAFSMKDSSDVAFNFGGDSDDLYQLLAAGWSSINSGFAMTGDNRWYFAEFGTICIATNLEDVMQKFDVDSDAAFAALAGTPPKAKYLAVVGDFLVAAHLSTSTNSVQWSGLDDITEWTSGVKESGAQALPEGGAITGITGGEFGLIFQERRVTRMDYQGPPLNFSFDNIENVHGAVSGGSVVRYGIYSYYLSPNGFFVNDGTQSIPISPEKVDSYFLAKADPTLYHKMSAVANPIDKTITWSYVGLDSIDTLPNWLIIYNWQLKRWSEASVRNELIFNALSLGTTLDGLDTNFPDLDAMTTSLDSNIWKGGVQSTLAIDIDHKAASFTGAALDATIKVAEYELTAGEKTALTEVWPQIDGTITVTLETRSNYQETPTPTGAISVNSLGFAPFTEVGRYHSFQFDFSGWTKASGFEFRGVGAGGY